MSNNAKPSLFLTLLTALPAVATAGTWEVAPAYTGYDDMVQLGDLIYVLSSSGNLFTYNTTDASMETLSRLDGMSGNSVACIVGTAEHDCMAIVYTDGDINLVHVDGSIVDLPDLKNKSMTDKTINNAQIIGNKLYISTGYGFSVVDLERELFSDSYIFNESCSYAFDYNGDLYMVTVYGASLYKCEAGANAYDRNQWQKQSSFSEVSSIVWASKPDYSTYYNACSAFIKAGDSLYYVLHPTDGLFMAQLTPNEQGNSAHLERISDPVLIDGPAFKDLISLDYRDGRLMGVGGYPELWDAVDFTPGTLTTYDEETQYWTNLTLSDLRGPHVPTHHYAFEGLTSLAIDPLHPERCAVGNLYDGLLIIEGDSVVAHYTKDNSPLEQYWKERVTALAYDDDGTLWMGNACQNSAALKALLPDGTWMSYPISGFDGGNFLFVTDILVSRNDPYRFKWASKTESGCAMYYDGGTPGDLTDDESVYFASLTDQDGNIITPGTYNGFAEDNNGAVWILTSVGPFVSDSPISTYNTQGTVRRIKIPRNDGTDLADYLLANVDTKCMVVDAANRKWIGTAEDGLFLLSADGLTTIDHFTTENSPLLSDEIISLAIDQETGRLFISTSGGILTYASEIISGKSDLSSVYCYPNPVRPEYSGDLCVTGLMDNTQVRITDINNNVVYAARSAGGSILWNLCNRNGKRVKPGVYLIYGVDESGKNGVVSKLLVVR